MNFNNNKAFTLIELLVVVAIIGILAAVGVVAYNGYTGAAKVNAAKTNYKNVIRWVKTELVKCNAGLSDKMFTSNPQSCPITHSNNFLSGMNNACRGQGGIFSQMKNVYKPTERLCDLAISYKNDNDVGKVNFSQKDWQNVRFSSCWKTPCSSSDNHEQIIINVTE